LDRVRAAILIPIGVFVVVAGIAIGVGTLLLNVHDIAHHSAPHDLAPLITPLVALVLVVIITASGFIASAMAGPAPSESTHP